MMAGRRTEAYEQKLCVSDKRTSPDGTRPVLSCGYDIFPSTSDACPSDGVFVDVTQPDGRSAGSESARPRSRSRSYRSTDSNLETGTDGKDEPDRDWLSCVPRETASDRTPESAWYMRGRTGFACAKHELSTPHTQLRPQPSIQYLTACARRCTVGQVAAGAGGASAIFSEQYVLYLCCWVPMLAMTTALLRTPMPHHWVMWVVKCVRHASQSASQGVNSCFNRVWPIASFTPTINLYH